LTNINCYPATKVNSVWNSSELELIWTGNTVRWDSRKSSPSPCSI